MKHLLALLALAGALLCICGPSVADDSGDENTLAVYEWSCFLCNKSFFSFVPDNLEPKFKKENKDFDYQQKNWLNLRTGNSIARCDKAPDGAHFMVQKREFTTSARNVQTLMNDYIVLKEGGQNLKAMLILVRCKVCEKSQYAFPGDDLDMYGKIALEQKLHLFMFDNGSNLYDCKGKLPSGKDIRAHVFLPETIWYVKSIDILKNKSRIIYSD